MLLRVFPAVRRRPEWLGKYDEPILELLAESEIAAPPAVVAFNLEWRGIASPAYSTVKRRLRKLANHSLLDQVESDKGYYAISDKGRAYLAGELDLEELDSESPD